MSDLSKSACQLSIQHLFRDAEFCYLWTYTFADDVPPFEAARRWRLFVRWHVQTARICVRVLESGGLNGRWHYHCVTPQRWEVNEVREAAGRYGFGRINVKKLPASKAHYVAKYLGKQNRGDLPAGQRRWACVGFDGVAVSRVQSSSETRSIPDKWEGEPYTIVEWLVEGLPPIRSQIRVAERPECEAIRQVHISKTEFEAALAQLAEGRVMMMGEYQGLSVTLKAREDDETKTRVESGVVEHMIAWGREVKYVTEWLPQGAEIDAISPAAEVGSVVMVAVRSLKRYMGREFVMGTVIPLQLAKPAGASPEQTA